MSREITILVQSVSEIERYSLQLINVLQSISDGDLWKAGPQNSVCIGTIAHHLAGNLRHFFGAGLLKNGYTRNRENEFAERNVSKKVLVANLQQGIENAKLSLNIIDEESVSLEYETPCGQKFPTLANHIVRLATHFSYHFGQVSLIMKYINHRA